MTRPRNVWSHDGGPDDSAQNMGLMRLPEFETVVEKERWMAAVLEMARKYALNGFGTEAAFANAMHFVTAEFAFVNDIRDKPAKRTT